jgi:hypothetical protein
LIGPTAASSSVIIPKRSTNSVIATIPDTPVNDRSATPTRTRGRLRFLPRLMFTRQVGAVKMILSW